MTVKTRILNTTRFAMPASLNATFAAAQDAPNPKNAADVLVSITTRSEID